MFDPWALLECVNAIRDVDQSRLERAITRRRHRKQLRKLSKWYGREIRNWAEATGSQYRAHMLGALSDRQYWPLVRERDEVLAAMEPKDRSAVKNSLEASEIDYHIDWA